MAGNIRKRSVMYVYVQQDDDQQFNNTNEAEPFPDIEEHQMSIVASERKPTDHPSGCPEEIIEGLRNIPLRTLRQPEKELWKLLNKVDGSSSATKGAEDGANLDPQYPKFAKMLKRSHVTTYILNLPRDFCEVHMPRQDTMCILEDENGKPYETEFRFHPGRFSYIRSGWKDFSLDHHLVEGDTVVFQLIETHKFKVFITRSTGLGVAGTPKPSLLEENNDGMQFGGEAILEKESKVYEKSTCEELGEVSNAKEATKCENSTAFVDFQDFKIFINGGALDFKLPDIRYKYYELCKAQKSYLHAGFLQTIDPPAAVQIISNAVGIADAIKSSTISTPKRKFADWDQTLKGFETLGLEVGFLHARVRKLLGLAKQVEDSPGAKRLKQATVEWNLKGVETETLEAELKTLEAKLQKVKQERLELFVKMENLNEEMKMEELRFLEEAKAPW